MRGLWDRPWADRVEEGDATEGTLMQSLAATIRGAHLEAAKRGGYDRDAVDGFLAELADRVAAVEDAARQETLRANALQRRFAVAGDAADSIETAYIAAAEAKQKLLEEAEQRAQEIIRQAEADRERMVAEPRLESQRIRKDAEDILLQAKARLDAADTEAKQRARAAAERVEAARSEAERITAEAATAATQLVDQARDEAGSIVAEARRDAMTIIASTQRQADELVAATREEHQAIVGALEILKAAVADMLQRGARGSEAIRVVLDDAHAAVALSHDEQAVV